MKEELISFKCAKLAKEKGFNVVVWDYYEKDTNKHYCSITREHYNKGYNISAPTQSLLQRWLWETHHIWVEVTLLGDGIGFQCIIKQVDGKEDDDSTIVRMLSQVNVGLACNTPSIALGKGLIAALNKIEI